MSVKRPAPSPAGPSRPRSRALPYGRFPWKFEYRPEDHDDGEKEFLGHRGRFNGEDIIDIVVEQPACARFVCRHLYNFFVADEPQVPAWSIEPPRDQKAIDTLTAAFRQSTLRHPLRPAGAVQLELLQERPLPAPEVARRGGGGQPASGGWLRAPETRLRRSVDAARLHGSGPAQSPERRGMAHGPGVDQQRLPDGPHQLRGRTGRRSVAAGRARHHRPTEDQGHAQPRAAGRRAVWTCWARWRWAPKREQELVAQAKEWGQTGWASETSAKTADKRVGEMLQLIVATREYQFA